MAITFGSDGILYCNSIKRNWGVGRNFCSWNGGLVPYPEDVGRCWYNGNNHLYNSLEMSSSDMAVTGSHYYYELRDTAYVRQRLPAMISGHKYYMACYGKVSGGTGYMRLLNNNSIVRSVTFSSSSWTWGSSVFSQASDYEGGDYTGQTGAVLSFNCTAGTFSFTKIIMFDITEAFNSTISDSLSNSSWKSWIDSYCREKRAFLNAENGSNMTNRGLWFAWDLNTSTWSDNYWKNHYPGNDVAMDDSVNKPWSLYLYAQTNSSSEHYLHSQNNYSPVTNRYYYMSMYALQTTVVGWTNDFFISETGSNFLGQVPILVTTSKYGGCKNWRKISKMGQPGVTTSAKIRVDLNGITSGRGVWYTLGTYESMGTVGSSDSNWISAYNTRFSCNITNTSLGVDSYFFDCWSETITEPFIHCPSPLAEDKKIQFNTTYDIVCNDLIIEPQQNKVYFDSIGRVHCRGISPTIQIFV